MKVRTKYKTLGTVCCTDEYGSTIQSVNLADLEGYGHCAMATDGSMMAVVPVSLEKNEVGRRINRDVWPTIFAGRLPAGLAKLGYRFASVAKAYVRTFRNNVDGKGMPDASFHNECEGTFPAFEKVLPDIPDNPLILSINPELLLRLATAIGSKDAVDLVLTPDKEGTVHSSIVVLLPTSRSDDGRNPFGIIMPRLSNSYGEPTTKESAESRYKKPAEDRRKRSAQCFLLTVAHRRRTR